MEGDDHGEAYTAIVWGVGDEPRNGNNAGAEAVEDAEGNMGGAAMRGSDALPGSKATSRSKGTRRGTWEISCPAWWPPAAPVRIGKARSRSR